MPAELKGKNFYGCTVSSKELSAARVRARKTMMSLPDMFHILLHNQTIMNEKLNDLLKGQGRSYN